MAEIGFIGLGRMGGNMTTRLRRNGHRVVVYDRDTGRAKDLAAQTGAVGTGSLAELKKQLAAPRLVWCMVPAGVTDAVLDELASVLEAGDTIIDGGNSNYKDTLARGARLAQKRIELVDAGTSGGIWGLENGYCLMVGGAKSAINRLSPIFGDLAPKDGWRHVGPLGAGHFAKMIHNGIEYGMMQAYAEGFELLKASDYDFDLAEIAALWNQGSVVRSWLLELTGRALSNDPKLTSIKGYVEDSGEGRWTILESIARSVPAPVLTLALQMRFRSRQDDSFAAKVCAALRAQFGGHATKDAK